MPELLLTCAQCQRPLRVPAELLGRPVKCPACGLTFTVPPENSPAPPSPEFPTVAPAHPSFEGHAAAPGLPRARLGFEEWDDGGRTRSALLPPALCLLFSAFVGLFLCGLLIANVYLLGDNLRAELQRQAALDPRLQPAQQEAVVELTYLFFKVVPPVGAVLSLIVALAAVQMLRLRSYWLAVTGSVLSLINIGAVCCLLGLPFGIWSLVVLLRPEIKNSFLS